MRLRTGPSVESEAAVAVIESDWGWCGGGELV